MNILIAPNNFKHTISATDAAEAIKNGLVQSRLDCHCECFPIADGGDGTASLLIKQLEGKTTPVKVHDPLGRIIEAELGLIADSRTAVIEMADASGLRLLKPDEYDPYRANTVGTGEMILHALDKGCRRIILGIGGSATVDGGTGLLQALGLRFYDGAGNPVDDLPAKLTQVAFVETDRLDPRLQDTELIVLCDVNNLLLGEHGAAAVFGPQKGAQANDIPRLEAALTNWRNITLKATGKDMAVIPHGGAAGGIAAGLAAYLNATLVQGIDYFLAVTGFESSLQKADLVITGEGSLDDQTLDGKGPFGVARLAKQHHLPVIAVAGRLPLHIPLSLQQYFDAMFTINHDVLSPAVFKQTKENLTRTAMQIGNLLAIGGRP